MASECMQWITGSDHDKANDCKQNNMFYKFKG